MRIEHHAFGEHIAGIPASSPTLEEALREVWAARWKETRWGKTADAQVRQAISTLHAIAGPGLRVADVSKAMLRQAVGIWKVQGRISPRTINHRLNTTSALGIDVAGCRVRVPRTLKWWLSPEAEAVLLEQLRETDPDRKMTKLAGTPRGLLLADYIEWTTRTGMRVEEVLRLTWAEVRVGAARTYITIPGTKTRRSQSSLPISEEASAVLARRRAAAKAPTRKQAIADAFNAQPRVPGPVVSRPFCMVGRFCLTIETGVQLPMAAADDVVCTEQAPTMRKPNPSVVFDISYDRLQDDWQEARKLLDLPDPYSATLKALRCSAARQLTVKGMPLDVLRQYLRHSKVDTTMGYLQLTGGYRDDEIARFL